MADAFGDSGFSAAVEATLQARAAALAIMTADDDAEDELSLLLFRIADEWYAVQTGDVREIFQDYQLTPMPCVPEFILGVVNVRGEILSVTDPARMMHLGSVGGDGTGGLPAVVISNDTVATALLVDEVGDIVAVANDAIEPPVSIIDRAQAEFIAGSVFVSERMVGLINVDRMLQPIGS
jgi:purine-binding chemotaxis protein CheW